MSTEWPDVPRVVDGRTSFSSTGLNPTVDALAERTDYLKNAIDNWSQGCSGLIYSDTGFSSDVTEVGTILAFVNGQYVPAKAVWSTVKREDGSIAPAPEAYVVGILVSSIVNGYGKIMSYGWTSDPALIAAMIGSDSLVAGQYFLKEDGGVVLGTEESLEVPVYCFTYCGTIDGKGKIVFNPKLPEYSGHSHGWAELPFSGWTVGVDSSVFVGGTSYPSVAAILGSTVSSAFLSQNGIGVDPDKWEITGNTIATDFQVFSSDKMILYMISPMLGRDPLVHSVTVAEGSGMLTADNMSGDVVLTLNGSPNSTNDRKGQAVISFDGNTFTTGPVVQRIVAEAGISAKTSATEPGTVVIGNDTYEEGQIDVNITNLDGVLFGTDSSHVTYKFPAGITSTLYGTVRLPHYSQLITLEPVLNLLYLGGGYSIPSLDVEVTVIPMPNGTGGSSATLYDNLSTTAIASTLDNKYYLSGCTSGASISPDAIINVKITATEPTNSIELAALSIQLAE